MRAAAFVHYPAVVAGGEVSNAFMTMMDISPNNSGELKKSGEMTAFYKPFWSSP